LRWLASKNLLPDLLLLEGVAFLLFLLFGALPSSSSTKSSASYVSASSRPRLPDFAIILVVWNADRRARIGLELEEGLVCFDRGDACKLVTNGGGFGLLTEEPGAVGRRDAIKRGAWILAPDEEVTKGKKGEFQKLYQ